MGDFMGPFTGPLVPSQFVPDVSRGPPRVSGGPGPLGLHVIRPLGPYNIRQYPPLTYLLTAEGEREATAGRRVSAAARTRASTAGGGDHATNDGRVHSTAVVSTRQE